MGNGPTKIGGGDYNAYEGAMDHYAKKWHGADHEDNIEGGDGCCSGGAETKKMPWDKLSLVDLRDYDKSLNSFVKDSLTADIVEALKSLGFSAEGNTREEQIDSILKKIPSSRVNGRAFKADAESHKRVCLKLADVINKRYGEIIDKRLEPHVVCQQVADVIGSLKSSMHVEFLSVYNEVRRVLRNLAVLHSEMTDVFAPIIQQINKSDDAKMKASVEKWISLYTLVNQHTEQQTKILQNLLDVTLTPSEVTLAGLVKADKENGSLISKLKDNLKPGSSAFGEYISEVLRGLTVTPAYALVIDKALKSAGMTIDEYAKADLPALMQKMMDATMNKEGNDAQLHELIESWDLLYKNFSRAKDIAAQLDRIKKSEKSGEYEMYGAADLEPTNVEKKLRDRRVVRNLVFQVFNRQLNEQFNRIVVAIDSMANKVGDGVPPSDQLEGFIKSIKRLTGTDGVLVNRRNAYVALIGYYNDAKTKEYRDTFLANLRIIQSYVDTMNEMAQYRGVANHLKDVADNIKAMIQLIDQYADKVSQKFGGDDDDKEETCLALGGAPDLINDNIKLPESVILRTSTNLLEAITKMEYLYKVSQIKNNLKHVEKENERFAEGYEDLRADSVAKKVQELLAQQTRLLEQLDDKDGEGHGKQETPYLWSWEKMPEGEAKKTQKKRLEHLRQSAIKYVQKQFEARINFWKTIEAIDEYMRVFTNGLVKDPSAVRDLKAMLDETENLSDWYNEKVGQDLHQIFDCFPAYIEGTGTDAGTGLTEALRLADAAGKVTGIANAPSNVRLPADAELRSDAAGHYYDKVHTAFDNFALANGKTDAGAGGRGADATKLPALAAHLPGNPYLVANPDNTEVGFSGKVHAKRTIQHLFALKNLIACFTYIGQKFAGEEIRKKVFMSPTQMYKNLVDYLDASAFGMGLNSLSYIHDPFFQDNYENTMTDRTFDPTFDAGMKNLEARVAELEQTPWVRALGRSPDVTSRGFGEALINLRNSLAVPVKPGQTAALTQSFADMIEAAARLPANKREKHALFHLADQFRQMRAVTRTAGAIAIPAVPVAPATIGLRAVLEVLSDVKNMHDQIALLNERKNAGLAIDAGVNRLWTMDNIEKIFANPTTWYTAANHAELVRLLALYRPQLAAAGPLADNLDADQNSIYGITYRGAYQGGSLDSFDNDNGVNSRARTYNFDHADWAGAHPRAERVGAAHATRANHILVRLGVTAKPVNARDPAYAEVDFRRRFGVYMRSVIKEFNGGAADKELDQFFARGIKAIAAKVLTIVGMYDVMDRPHEVQVMNPVRMILGAADDTPKIEPAAVELYIRLPLLLEFYRDLFGFNKSEGDQSWVPIEDDEQKFTLLPEMEGTFAGLVRLLFKKSKNISMNNLSDQDLRDIIKEINMIYAKNSGKGDSLVIDTVRELIDEMNRRFGLLKKRERDRYEKDFGYRYDYDEYAKGDFGDMLPRDIAILPDEDKVMAWDEAPVTAPSDRYLEKSKYDTPLAPARESKNKIREEHYKLFYRFRCMLDNYFRNGNSGRAYTMGGPESDYSFKPAIKQAMIELKNEANNDERFKIVTRLIRGYSAFRRVDLHKYVLFHETVVTGLNTLSGIYTLLVNYKNLILATDLKRISEELFTTPRPAGPADNIAWIKLLIQGENYRQANANLDSLIDKFNNGGAGVGAAVSGLPNDAAKEDALRQIMNYPLIMRHLIETIFTMSNDLGGLVQFSFSDRIALNWSGLREAIEQTFAQVRYFMDLLRPHIDQSLFDRFVNKDNAGSFYWLQEQLMDKILVGRDAGAVETEPNEFSARVQYLNLEQLTVKLNDTYRHLVRNAGASADEWTPAADPATARRVAYDQVFASMIFYDAKHAGNNSGILGCKQVGPRNPAELIDFGKPINTLLLKPQGDKWMFFPNQSNRYVQLYSWGDEPEFTFQRSLMLGFNQLLAKMIHQFYDPAVGKVYLNLFNPLISGALNAQVMNPDACYPDTIRTREPTNAVQTSAAANTQPPANYPTGSVGVLPGNKGGKALNLPTLIDTPYINVQRTDSTDKLGESIPKGQRAAAGPPALTASLGRPESLYSFGTRADPKPDAILFSTLALVLKNIASGKNKMGQSVYAAENIADVSNYIKDKFKAQLPVFKNLFNILIRKGELLKTLISKRDDNMLNLSRGDLTPVLGAANVNARTNATKGMYGLADMGTLNATWVGAAGNDKTARDWTALIDALNKACQGAITGIDQVLRELADAPKYLELNPGFINDYRNNYKKDPFMPISSLLTVFKNNEAGEPYPHLPFFNPGSPEYKLAYGERQVLAQPDTPVSMDQLPGHKALIDAYNMGAGKDAVNKEAAEKYTSNLVKLLRYVNEAKQYRANLLNMWNDAWSLGRVSAALTAGADQAGRNYIAVPSAECHFLQGLLVSNGAPAALAGGARSNTLAVVLTDTKPVARNNDKWIVPAFALNHSNREVVDLTENSFRDQKLEEFVKYLHSESAQAAPDLKVQNILDLNVVPINVNAMMRDIPLVNIYNYAYTFDRLIVELLFGIQSDVANDILKHLCQNADPNAVDFRDKIARDRTADPQYMRDNAGAAARAAPRAIRSTKDLFLALLVDPYRELLSQGEWDYLNGIFTGDNNMDLGRPKFLSDQLYNKALFMELYPDMRAGVYQEHGPRRTSAQMANPAGGPYPAAPYPSNKLTYITNQRKNRATADVNDYDDQEYDYVAETEAAGNYADTGVKAHNISADYKEVLRILSKLRAQTVFVRNIVFLVNVYRLLRLKLRKDLVYNKGLVLKGHAIVRESNTEFARNQSYRPYKWA